MDYRSIGPHRSVKTEGVSSHLNCSPEHAPVTDSGGPTYFRVGAFMMFFTDVHVLEAGKLVGWAN